MNMLTDRFVKPPQRQPYAGFGAVVLCEITPNPAAPMRLKPGALVDAIAAVLDEAPALAHRTGGYLEEIQGTTAVFYWTLEREAVDYSQIYAGLRELIIQRDTAGGALCFRITWVAQEITVEANRTSAQRELHLQGEAWVQAKRLSRLPSAALVVTDELTHSLIQADARVAVMAEFGVEILR